MIPPDPCNGRQGDGRRVFLCSEDSPPSRGAGGPRSPVGSRGDAPGRRRRSFRAITPNQPLHSEESGMALQPARRYQVGTAELPSPPPGWDSFEAVMELALAKAREAATAGETPVGAVVLSARGKVLGQAGNAVITLSDPTAHAELLALRAAAARVGNYRLTDAILAVTLEPCLMCLGAMVHARVGLLVYGAPDPRTGAINSRLPGPDLPFFNHRFDVVSGVSAATSGQLLKDFFRSRRVRPDDDPDRDSAR